ncbi:putative P-loop containing nucleoside triphosphate hydrolase, leucine-rich repeat domain, L [Medicago truncatula]|uniref:Putative P-loop containing nucleoside triphosphate hydrolase, leucine-rich repeat domain, L n=1 Tax=Medicago truncatula TaxID=3880 RepID=A0A396IQG6_MEDTR|nr:putative P-loop containing nucleoside triphosphate hydrolase, leucine-rich repeat domain, L [Medicago truncatula]
MRLKYAVNVAKILCWKDQILHIGELFIQLEHLLKVLEISFLTDLAKPYVEKLINGAITGSSYICCLTCIAKDFEEQRARLEIERTTVKQRVDVATRRVEDVQANVLFWEKEADELIQEDTKTKQKCLFGFCPHIIWRYKRGKELTNKKEQIKRLIETGKELSIGLPAPLPGVERHSSQHYITFKSRESQYKELLEALKDDNNYVIGLIGMGGTGKTRMAIEVGKELMESKQFACVIDTTMSTSVDIRKIQNDIAGPLDVKFDDCTESDRPRKLWKRLTNGEKILIILDDVWGDINFVEIGIPQSGNHKGCRILVTTRSLLVCNTLRCNKTVQLEVLSVEEAWTMFQRYSEISTKSLLDKGRNISNECKGLPVAIVAIASSLKGEHRLEVWDATLNSLQMHDVEDDLIKVYKCLQVSYDNMKNEKAKKLFLLCSVFRDDEKIHTERLTRLGIGGGLFGEDYVSYKDARSQVIISIKKLLDSYLFLEADGSRVKMHDLVRDAAQWIANTEIQTVKLYDKNQKAMVERNMNIKYLFCEGKLKDVFSFKLGGSKLEILIVNMHKDEDYQYVKNEVPNSFFENSMSLRVFLLISVQYLELTVSLPQFRIPLLRNIRSLLFVQVDLGDISILGNLQSLETFDLDGCKIDELPHGITKLEKFRLLKLEYCEIARNNPFEVIEGCSSLEELYFTGSFNNFCREITFPKFQRFDIGECVSINESLSKCFCVVYKYDVFLSKTTLKDCMQEAEVLKINRMEGGGRNIIPEMIPMGHGMNDLVELDLRSISQLQCLIDTKHTGKVFSKLVVLELWNLDNLEELCNGPLSFDSLNSLEKLYIINCKHLKSLFKCKLNLFNLKSVLLEGCPMLISLFQLSTAVSLVLLERLVIKDCEGLENIIIDERKGKESRGEIINDNESTSQGSIFQKLEFLGIYNCPRIESILPFLYAHDLPALESIRIESCDKLKYIFGKDVKLGSLREIDLDDLPNMIDIFPECNRTMSLSIKKTSSISGDASNPQTQSEPIKCNIFSWTDIYCCGKKYGHNKLRSTTNTKVPLVSEDQQQENVIMESDSYCLPIWERAQCLSIPSHILCNIKEITLNNISKMKSVFILSIAPRMLLESLTISKCDELKHIIIDVDDHNNTGANNLVYVFPKLRDIDVEDCEKLEYIIGHFNDDHQNHTQIHLQLPALEFLYLENLPSLVANYPKQYHTTFPQLEILEVEKCPQFIGDFITHHSVTRSVDDTIIKESGGNVEHFRALESLKEINEQQMNLALKIIELLVLPMMTCLFMGPKNSFSLQNLTHLKIIKCEKLKIVFSTSIIRCLPQLNYMRIEECNELKHIIEDDLENTTKTCFPKLRILFVEKCNKLKYVFPISICKELPELNVLTIREADEVEEIFGSEGDDHKVEIPNLKFVVFENLRSLCHDQGIQFEAVKHRLILNCQKLSLTSASTADFENDISGLRSVWFDEDYELYVDLKNLFKQLHDESKGHDTCNEYPSSEITEVQASGNEFTSSQKEMEQTLETEHEFVENVPHQEMPSVAIKPTNSKEELMNEQEMEQKRLLGETDATVKPSQENNGIEKSVEDGITSANAKTIKSSPGHLSTSKEFMNEQQSLGAIDTTIKSSQGNNLEGSTSEKLVGETLSTISGTKNEPPIQLVSPEQKGIEKSVEEGTTSTCEKTITSSTHLEVGDGKIFVPSFSIVNTKPASTKDVDIEDSQETTHEFFDSAKLIEEDPLLALETLLTGVQSFPVRTLLEELKTLMDSSSDLDHLVSNQESKSK